MENSSLEALSAPMSEDVMELSRESELADQAMATARDAFAIAQAAFHQAFAASKAAREALEEAEMKQSQGWPYWLATSDHGSHARWAEAGRRLWSAHGLMLTGGLDKDGEIVFRTGCSPMEAGRCREAVMDLWPAVQELGGVSLRLIHEGAHQLELRARVQGDGSASVRAWKIERSYSGGSPSWLDVALGDEGLQAASEAFQKACQEDEDEAAGED